MSVLAFYVLIVAGFVVARSGLRTGGGAARAGLVLVGGAVLVATACWFGRDLQRASDVLRYALSATALAAGVQIVTGERPVQCALALLVVFFCLAGIYVTYQAEFLAAITISINAGAVVVTFLFILMLIDLRTEVGGHAPGWSAAAAALGVVLVALVLVGIGSGGEPTAAPPEAWYRMAGSAYGADVQNTRLKEPPPEGADEQAWMDQVPEDELAAMRSGRPYPLRPLSGYTSHLGWELYTKYTVPFEVASLILTVAVVGAVAIGRQGAGGEEKTEA